jgi:hypothetical protein
MLCVQMIRSAAEPVPRAHISPVDHEGQPRRSLSVEGPGRRSGITPHRVVTSAHQRLSALGLSGGKKGSQPRTPVLLTRRIGHLIQMQEVRLTRQRAPHACSAGAEARNRYEIQARHKSLADGLHVAGMCGRPHASGALITACKGFCVCRCCMPFLPCTSNPAGLAG